ncbi:MAG: hypothetical protein HEQ11_06780 [Gemmatimonas sp.]
MARRTWRTPSATAVKEQFPDKSVACMSARVFAEEYIAAMQEGGVERWRTRYRHADLCIIDDLQLLESKERTQEELFHVFNHFSGAMCRWCSPARVRPRR